MTFALSETLINDIISAMENQDEVFVVDSELGDLATQEPDEDRYYSLPDWGPAEGFALREAFVQDLHNPAVHDELQAILHSGRGVFKSFRNVLKEYPEVDKRWHIYKHRFMSARINEWYNSLRDVWGLEKLEQLPEEEESFVYDDFSFRNFDGAADCEYVLSNISAKPFDDDLNIPKEVNDAVFALWKKQFLMENQAEQSGFVCNSFSDEFAGVITASSLIEKQEQTVVITSLFVSEQFRGLGICSELLSKCISDLQGSGIKWILLPNIFAPDIIQPLLTRTGFKKTNLGYLLSLGD